MSRGRKWKPVDTLVGLIVVVLGVGLIMAAATPYFLGVPISDKRSEIIGAVVTAMVSIVSMYVGARIRNDGDDDGDDDE